MTAQSNLAEDAKAHLKDVSTTAADRVKTEAKAQAERLRSTATEKVQNASNAANAAATQFDHNSMQAEVARQVADRIEDVATHLRHADMNNLVAQTSAFARRNPLLFIGGAAALGFVATRFLRAQSPARRAHAEQGDPWAEVDMHAAPTPMPHGDYHG